MKTIKFFAIILVVALLGSCETKTIKLYPTIEENRIFYVANDGYSNSLECISVNQITEKINDLEQDGEITAVFVEGIWIELKKDAVKNEPLTTADSTKVNLYLMGWDGVKYLIVKDLVVDVTKDEQTLFLYNKIQKEAIVQLRQMILDVALGMNNKSEVCLELVSENSPEGTYLNTTVNVFVKAAIEYAQEIESI